MTPAKITKPSFLTAPVQKAHVSKLDSLVLENSLHAFMKEAWRYIEPRPFVDGWHIQAICEHLEAVSAGQIRNLMINVPPRHTKSLTVSVIYPAWEWGPHNHPDIQWLCMSYGARLSLRDSLKCRNLIQSAWYRKNWGHRFKLVGDQNAKERYNNDKQGARIASSVGGMGTGEGGERLIVDDAHNLKDVQSEVKRLDVIDWWDMVMPTRLNNPKSSANIVTMQRSHHDDLAGHIKEQDEGDWVWLVLPAEYDPRRSKVTIVTPAHPDGWKDIRTKAGEVLWEERFPKKELEKLKHRMGSHYFEGQCNQNPSKPEGAIIKRQWIKYYEKMPARDTFDFVFQSWDMAFKSLKTSSYVAGQVWGAIGANLYLLDRVREHLSFTESVKAVEDFKKLWPEGSAIYIEDKANGTAIIDTLKNKIPGIKAVQTHESKEARAFAVTPDFEAGNIWIPAQSLRNWAGEYVEQLSQFPMGAYSDDTDATTQAITQARLRQQTFSQELPPVVSMTRSAPWHIGR